MARSRKSVHLLVATQRFQVHDTEETMNMKMHDQGVGISAIAWLGCLRCGMAGTADSPVDTHPCLNAGQNNPAWFETPQVDTPG
jgi:hypothetical protein